MTIKTFDANRVGGGTFQLEQDPLTGEYKVKEVGFIKLPELKLPEIDQAAYKTPTPYIPGTDSDPDTDLPDVGGGGSDGGGGGDQQDFTGASTYKNIQDQAIQLSKNLQTMIDNQEAQERAAGVSVEGTPLTTTDVSSANQEAQELAAGIGPEKQFASQMIAERKASQMGPGSSNPRKPGRSLEQRNIPEASQALDDEYYDFDRTPINQGTFTRESIDKSFLGEEGPSQNLITKTKDTALKAKDVVSNSKPVQLIGAGARIAGTVLKGAATAILGPETNSQVHARKYFNIAGTSGQPQRIAGNPAENVFAGANANAKDLNRVAQKRIDTIEKNLAAGKYRDPDKKRQQLKDFKEQQANYKKDQRQEAIKRKGLDTKNPNEMRQTDGGADSSPGGKIVCTMMNESYGFGSFRNKIWMKFHGNIAPEYQKGYHKLFLPLVSYAKQKGITNKIIKNILEHIAVHSTIDMRQALRGKRHLLGRVYRKVILPLCYWAGRK